jgi:hypothetical protein
MDQKEAVKPYMELTAPYADYPIVLSLQSLSTERYKTYYCFECGHAFLQRDNDTLYRINSNDEPGRLYSDDSGILVRCGRCKQKYSGHVAVSPPRRTYSEAQTVTLQSIYLTPVADKQQRYTHCMECDHTFVSITDRISMIVDNVIPLEHMDKGRIGLMEVRCNLKRCRQPWAMITSY